MKSYKFPNYVNSIFLLSLIVLSLFVFVTFENVQAQHSDEGITKSLVVGINQLTYRDSSNTEPQNAIVSLDTSTAISGFVTITIEEEDSNLDFSAVDIILSSATSTSSGLVETEVQLEETGPDTGIFSGRLILSTTTEPGKLEIASGDAITVLYEPEHEGVGRISAELSGITVAGDVEIFDYSIDDPDGFGTRWGAACPYNLVTHPVEIKLPAGNLPAFNLGGTSEITITISYANAELEAPLGEYDPATQVKMLYRTGGQSISPIGELTSVVIDPNAKTFTGTYNGFLFPDLSGQYALGVKINGCVGGGGGGLIKPGFVVNALAGANVISSFFGKGGASGASFGGGNGPADPIVTSGTVSILSDESIGFLQQGITSDSDSDSTSKSLDSTQNVVIGKDLTFKYNVYENRGPDRIIHATMYFIDAQMLDANDRIDVSKSETYIRFEKGQPVKVVDPYGYFEKASFELLEIDTYNAELKYDITFGKIMPESHIVLRTWDAEKYSTDTFYESAIVVSEDSIGDNEAPLTQSEFEASSFLDTQFENPLAEEQTSTKTGFPGIPFWVKNNAMWWHEKQIDDADFVAGIQYLINEEIITIPETTITSSTAEGIPQWVSDVAGFWSNDQIPDDQFVGAMQWLVSNGVMEV